MTADGQKVGQKMLEEVEDLKRLVNKNTEYLVYVNRNYQLLTSTSHLDRSTGTCKYHSPLAASRLIISIIVRNNTLTPPRKPRLLRAPSPQPASQDKTTRRLVKDWLAEAGISKSVARKDRRMILSRFYDLSISSKDTLWWIMATPELKDWLTKGGPQNLLVQSETPADDLLNPLSFAAAFLADRIQSIDENNIPVLSFMTGVRRVESVDIEPELRPLSIMNHLNSQLLAFILKQRIQVDLSAILKDPKNRTRTQSRLSAALLLTEQILTQFPEDSMLFIIIDSAATHDGGDDDGTELRLFKTLLQLGDRTSVAVKVLLTDTLPGLESSLRKVPFETLLVPDSVDGERQDLAFETLAEDADETAFVPFLDMLRASDGEEDEEEERDSGREDPRDRPWWSGSDSDA